MIISMLNCIMTKGNIRSIQLLILVNNLKKYRNDGLNLLVKLKLIHVRSNYFVIVLSYLYDQLIITKSACACTIRKKIINLAFRCKTNLRVKTFHYSSLPSKVHTIKTLHPETQIKFNPLYGTARRFRP